MKVYNKLIADVDDNGGDDEDYEEKRGNKGKNGGNDEDDGGDDEGEEVDGSLLYRPVSKKIKLAEVYDERMKIKQRQATAASCLALSASDRGAEGRNFDDEKEEDERMAGNDEEDGGGADEDEDDDDDNDTHSYKATHLSFHPRPAAVRLPHFILPPTLLFSFFFNFILSFQ